MHYLLDTQGLKTIYTIYVCLIYFFYISHKTQGYKKIFFYYFEGQGSRYIWAEGGDIYYLFHISVFHPLYCVVVVNNTKLYLNMYCSHYTVLMHLAPTLQGVLLLLSSCIYRKLWTNSLYFSILKKNSSFFQLSEWEWDCQNL